jgi:hypothetical protein
MSCTRYDYILRCWTWFVQNGVEEPGAEEGPAVRLYWKMVAHRERCEVCRDEDLANGIVPLRILIQ